MKVVLFCGGLGMRLRDYSDTVPKPLIPVGERPLIWHLMRYYAHFGHRDFILCLGYGGDALRRYFEAARHGATRNDEVAGWRIQFVDTGIDANIGQRLRAVEEYVAGDELFLANYADGLTDCPLPDQIAFARRRRAVASFLSVKPNLSYHAVMADDQGIVTDVIDFGGTGLRVNGGFFVFRREIFRELGPGEDLVVEPFQRLMRQRRLAAYAWDGFWLAVDTAKDKHRVDEIVASGTPPWQCWEEPARAAQG